MANPIKFIEQIAPSIQEEARANGYKIASTVIAQACLESGYGESELARKYFNYFGMKCGGAWKGKSVTFGTWEEYEEGVITDTSANFRVYNSKEEGIKGYYDFIDWDNYANLKSAETAEEYARMLKADGWATDSKYESKLMSIVNSYNLTIYDKVKKSVDEMAQEVIEGKWGNNPERKERLLEAGYDYDAIQDRVDEILKPKEEPKEEQRLYTVKSGDTLWSIAVRYLGNGNRWKELAEYNSIENPSLIYPNQVLKLPKM